MRSVSIFIYMIFGHNLYFQVCSVDNVASFVPTETKPSTQLIIDCDKGGVAEEAGLQAGDFVIEVRGTGRGRHH